MKPIFTDHTNKIFDPNSDLSLAVPLTQYILKNQDDSEESIVSEVCWELSDEDLKHINKTRHIYTRFLGDTIPAIQINKNPLSVEQDLVNKTTDEGTVSWYSMEGKNVTISEDYIQNPRQTAIDINISFKANTTLSDDIVDLIVNGQLGIKNLIEEYLYDHVEILGNHFEDYEINTHKAYIIKEDK